MWRVANSSRIVPNAMELRPTSTSPAMRASSPNPVATNPANAVTRHKIRDHYHH